jgi:hypothetical protein
MGILRQGDEHLHYCDSSHRWVAPGHLDQIGWDAGMRAHLAEHRATMGGQVKEDERASGPTPRIPRQRDPRLASQRT